ncbi:Lipase 1 [Fusarium oxysporum f. sp. cubense race 1]|uniref:Carboxylic ester hydrolase n=1 Tax=Fusarium oxysporum f. sp. cubense (strain race 1) TaxID=1229664 RepID=N4UPT8_FUSC1|nr:Lipase 1 [Fusarium oxysporum f. sp. cubense race 1]
MQPKKTPERAAVVQLPTASVPSKIQIVVGKRSPISDDVEEFRGIPYAHVPGRWEHSRLRDRLPRDIYDATENGPRCPTQGNRDTRVFQSYLPYPDDRQDEFECLNLFVVRPSKEALAKHDIDAETTRLPVLIWIHGGGFIAGAGTDPVSDPCRLVLRSLSNKTPFIAVSINYRLGIFGFGASSDMIVAQGSDSSLKGVNFGLYDQKLALIWVKRNIAAFGGDDNKITIMGQSAGGISCHLHLLEAELGIEKPLFCKAGLISGPLGGLELTSMEKSDQRWAELCRLCYPSEAAAEEVLQAYGILPTSSDEELFKAFSQFISDATMMHKVYRVNEFFKAHRGKQALLRGQDPKRVGVHYHHFEFGNPFSGPMQGIAHHGVDMVYTFGNFHDALRKADQGVSEGYIEPGQVHAEASVGEPSSNTEATDYRKSNVDLSYELQDKLIQFVVEDCQETDQRAYADDIVTFCHDRSVRVENWSSSEKWIAKRKKLEVLDKYYDSMTSATQRLVGSVIGMAL